jgi:hypothetical protein
MSKIKIKHGSLTCHSKKIVVQWLSPARDIHFFKDCTALCMSLKVPG